MNVYNDYVNCYHDVGTKFDFEPPTLEDVYGFMLEIDVNSSSCVKDVNSKMCKLLMDKIPDKFHHLFANSLFMGKFPTAWTCAQVTLIPKDGNKDNPGNWRPISQTVIFAKILEKIVHKQILKYFTDNNILTEHQYGFLPGKSTQEAVFNATSRMYSCINQNKVMGVIYLDIAKAFNCIDHEILFKKLYDVGMSIRVIEWFRSYLTRSQTVKYGNTMSYKLPLDVGIAQGTVLSPLVFIFYINDCLCDLNDVNISMFADDCILYFTGNAWENVYTKLQCELDKFVDWTTRNMLKLNSDKTQAMIVGSRNKLSKIKNPRPFKIMNSNVKFLTKYKYLAVILDSELSLVPLCKSVEKGVSDKVYMLRKIRKYLNYKSSIQIYKQLILPVFYYPGFLLIACNNSRKKDCN